MGELVRVAVCDDDPAVLRAMAVYVDADPRLVLVGACGSGALLLELLARERVDVAVVDVRMPDVTGPQVARRIADSRAGVRVVYLTSYPGEVPVEDALSGCVAGALTKDMAPGVVTEAIVCAARGVTLLAPSFVGGRARPGAGRLESLVEKRWDREILVGLAKGRSSAQIARELFASESFVKQAVARLARSAGVSGRVELAVWLNGADPS